MKSRLEEDLRIGDLEGLILDKFQVDSFQPKFCDEKDVAVVAFLVTQRESAVKLSDYITRGPFNFLNVEASSSPDENGSYVVLAELDRSQEMFNTIDQLLHYIDRQVHIRAWHFKPYSSEEHLPWSRENFVRTVPQDPQEFQTGKNGDSKEKKPSAPFAPRKSTAAKNADGEKDKDAGAVNYSLLARIVEREISKSSRSYFVEFQKQFRKVSKDNRRLLHQFKEIKTDHQHLIKQLDLHQTREKLALMREQQDIKRIRDLEDRLTYLLVAGSDKRKISVTDASTPTIAIEPGDSATAEKETEEIVETRNGRDKWALGDDAPGEQDAISGDGTVEEAEILSTDGEAAAASPSDDAADKQEQSSSEKATVAYERYGEDTEAILNADVAATLSDDSPVSEIFRQAMQASEQKNYPRAIEHFTRITEISPDEPRAYYNLAILYFRQADYQKAEQFANAAIELGADGARKILNKAKARKSAGSGRKAGHYEHKGGSADENLPPEHSRRHKDKAQVSPAEDPLTGIEQKTVEIGSPSFAVPPAPDDETPESADQAAELSSTHTDLPKEEKPPSFTGVGSDDTIVVDSNALAAVEQVDEAATALPAGQDESSAEQLSPADSSVPTITAEPMDIENMPTASLDDFIQADADVQPLPAEQSVVEDDLDESPPEPGQAPSEQASPVAPEAGLEIDGTQAPDGDAAGVAPEMEAETEEIEVHPEGAGEKQLDPAAVDLPAAAAEMPPETPETVKTPEVHDVQPKKASAEEEKSPPVVEADLFTRGLAASEKKNYAEALQLFTRFVELNPGQPRGFYNLAILHYRLKDFETARDMARKALDMGIGSAQKVYEKSQIRLAKERSIAMADNIESAATDTIFEELDTAAFETIDPSDLEEIPVTDAVVPPPPPADVVEEVLSAPKPADQPEPSGGELEIELPPPAAADQASDGIQNAEAIPEFPVFTGDLAQDAGVSADDAGAGPAEESLPEVDAMPIPDPTAVPDDLPAAADEIEPPAPGPSPGGQLAEPDAAVAGQDAVDPKTVAAQTAEQRTEPPEKMPAETGKPARSKAVPDKDSEALFAQGMKAYSSKNFDEAIEFFKRFIALRPREPRGYYNLAIVQYRRKEYTAAKSNAEKAAKLGARAARKILQKIKKKQLKSRASSSGPATAGKQKPRKRRTAGKGSRAAAKKRKKKIAPAQPPVPGSPADTISTPEPVESRKTGESIGDITDYDTATFDIAEVLGHDPVVWDADDMEEEVDTSEIQSPLIGGETGDDVIVFESATTADTAKSAATGSQQPVAAPPDTAASSDSLAGRSAKQTKAKSAGSGEVPGSDVFALGLAASEKKEYLKAIRYFKKFTELLPNDPRGYYNLAVVSYRLKSYQTAREHAKRAQELGSKPAAKILTKLKSIQVAA